MHQAGLASTNRSGFRRLENTIPLRQAVHWAVSQRHAADESAALALFEELSAAHLLGSADSSGKTTRLAASKLLRLAADAPKLDKAALNAGIRWQRDARPAIEVAEKMRRAILVLYERHLSPDGRAVNYAALAADKDYLIFLLAAAELQAVDPTPLDSAQRTAFFINTYNALIIHAQASLGGPSGILSRSRWFSAIKYTIGGCDYSADDMEHGILRANRPAASSLAMLLGHPEWSGGHFKASDPRLRQAVGQLDKRIHFALNCGAKSCPPIKVYTPETLEEGLQSAAAAFCEGEVSIREEDCTVVLSKLFMWYKQDFGAKQELLPWLLDYLPAKEAAALKKLMDTDVDRIRVEYSDYNWDLNAG